MIARYQALQQRIRIEVKELERTIAAIERHWTRATTAGADQDAYVNSVALNLHSFYAGVERSFRLIAVELDGGTLGGEAWHSELLQQMTLELPDVRPPVLQDETARELDAYRKFRHLIRNIYATNIDPNRMSKLVTGLPDVWKVLRRDLDSFLEFLDAVAHADS